MEEHIYSSNGVFVSKSRLVVSGDTYAMNGITSVKLKEKKKDFFLLFAFTIIVFIFTIIRCANHDYLMAVISAAVFVGCVLWIKKLRAPNYVVLITTSSGESEAFSTNEKQTVLSIIEAINQAIISRG